jgi:hypothetical protein
LFAAMGEDFILSQHATLAVLKQLIRLKYSMKETDPIMLIQVSGNSLGTLLDNNEKTLRFCFVWCLSVFCC